MPAARLNLSIEQGTTWRHSVALKAGANANAPALNLTGYSALMHIRSEQAATETLAVLGSSAGGITIIPLDGLLNLLLTAAQTAAFDFDSAVYDLEITSAGGEVTRVLQGNVLLSREVTRG